MSVRVGKSSGVSKASGAKAASRSETPRVSFREILDYQDEDRAKRHLEELLAEIEEKGRRLSENRTVEALFEYKAMVKGFVEEAVEFGLKIDEKRGFSRGGRSRILRVVSAVDHKLLELTDIIIKQEKKNMGILGKVGEIKGLLVSIYL